MDKSYFDLLKNSLEGEEIDRELYARIFYIRIDKIIDGIESNYPKSKKKTKNIKRDKDIDNYYKISAKIAYYYLMSVFRYGFVDGINIASSIKEAAID